jgi:hypothetical protein
MVASTGKALAHMKRRQGRSIIQIRRRVTVGGDFIRCGAAAGHTAAASSSSFDRLLV